MPAWIYKGEWDNLAADTRKSRFLAREVEQLPESEPEQVTNQDYPQVELIPEKLVVRRSWIWMLRGDNANVLVPEKL